ncbi:MAG: hypothetical protein M1825_003842 [Sarcosagium campestre]|nr:MAG: hypothetical protein M1825_003842 [Sarcosagium campestre]
MAYHPPYAPDQGYPVHPVHPQSGGFPPSAFQINIPPPPPVPQQYQDYSTYEQQQIENYQQNLQYQYPQQPLPPTQHQPHSQPLPRYQPLPQPLPQHQPQAFSPHQHQHQHQLQSFPQHQTSPLLQHQPQPLLQQPHQSQSLPQLPRQSQAHHVSYSNVPPPPQAARPSFQIALPKPEPIIERPRTPVDYKSLLASLSETYLNAAHEFASSHTPESGAEELKRYHKLVATGLGCLDSLLKNYRLEPRAEAVVRLKYATALYEETENTTEAEVVLSKGITLCERNRFVDLKYSMQHLMVRVIYTKSPKAATKSLDGIIQAVEAYQHTPWLYAFRLLRVSLSLELSTQSETAAALHNLRSLSSTANGKGDDTVFIFAAIMEALAHLRSASDSAIEQAQRALAAARSLQLTEAVVGQPQLVTLIHVLDLICSLMESNPAQAIPKMDALKALMDKEQAESTWTAEGIILVPIKQRQGSSNLVQSTGGIFLHGADGFDRLAFSWLPARDVYALSFFLCGAAMSHRSSHDGHKAEKYFLEGIKMAARSSASTGGSPPPKDERQTLIQVTARQIWRKTLQCYMRLHLALLLCGRSDWTSARAAVHEVGQDVRNLDPAKSGPIRSAALYVEGVIHQGSGDVSAALAAFSNPIFTLPDTSTSPVDSLEQMQCDLSILAALNSVFIFRNRSPTYHSTIETLISTLEPFCLTHPNRNIQCGFQLIKATSHPSDPMIKTKQYMQNTLQAAKAIENTQLSCIILHFVSWKFFTGVVSPQAEKSVRAAWQLAKRGDNDLWVSVAEGMMADTLEVQGKTAEAQMAREGASKLAQALSPNLQAPIS